jgi:hypothetical protein
VVSLRESYLSDDSWRVMSVMGSAVEFKKKFGEAELARGDLRTRLIKLGLNSLRPGMLCMGYVNLCNDKGCFVRFSHD